MNAETSRNFKTLSLQYDDGDRDVQVRSFIEKSHRSPQFFYNQCMYKISETTAETQTIRNFSVFTRTETKNVFNSIDNTKFD